MAITFSTNFVEFITSQLHNEKAFLQYFEDEMRKYSFKFGKGITIIEIPEHFRTSKCLKALIDNLETLGMVYAKSLYFPRGQFIFVRKSGKYPNEIFNPMTFEQINSDPQRFERIHIAI